MTVLSTSLNIDTYKRKEYVSPSFEFTGGASPLKIEINAKNYRDKISKLVNKKRGVQLGEKKFFHESCKTFVVNFEMKITTWSYFLFPVD